MTERPTSGGRFLRDPETGAIAPDTGPDATTPPAPAKDATAGPEPRSEPDDPAGDAPAIAPTRKKGGK